LFHVGKQIRIRLLLGLVGRMFPVEIDTVELVFGAVFDDVLDELLAGLLVRRHRNKSLGAIPAADGNENPDLVLVLDVLQFLERLWSHPARIQFAVLFGLDREEDQIGQLRSLSRIVILYSVLWEIANDAKALRRCLGFRFGSNREEGT